MGLFDSLFFPKKKKNIFNTKRYLQDLEKGLFRNKFNLGIQYWGTSFSGSPVVIMMSEVTARRDNFDLELWLQLFI